MTDAPQKNKGRLARVSPTPPLFIVPELLFAKLGPKKALRDKYQPNGQGNVICPFQLDLVKWLYFGGAYVFWEDMSPRAHNTASTKYKKNITIHQSWEGSDFFLKIQNLDNFRA